MICQTVPIVHPMSTHPLSAKKNSYEIGVSILEMAIAIALIAIISVTAVARMGYFVNRPSCQVKHQREDVESKMYFKDGSWHCRSDDRFSPFW